MRSTPPWTVLLPVVVLGCVARTPPVLPVTSPPVASPTRPLEGALFLQAFDAVWMKHPHRISGLRVQAGGGLTPDSDRLTGDLAIALHGGSWASGEKAVDVPRLSVSYGALSSRDVHFVAGHADLSITGSVRKASEDTPDASVSATIPLPEGHGWSGAAAWLTGFSFSTLPSHPNGYTPHAIGVQLSPVRIMDDHAEVDVRALFEAAPVPDRRQQLGAYGAKARVDYVIAFTRDGAVPRAHADVSLERGVEPTATVRRGSAARAPFGVDVPRTGAHAVAGLSGFTLEVDRDGRVAGRYIRAITAGVEDGRYDPGRGRWDGLAALRFTNAGDLSRAIKIHGTVDADVIIVDAAASVSAGRWAPPTAGQAQCAGYPELTPRSCPSDPPPASD